MVKTNKRKVKLVFQRTNNNSEMRDTLRQDIEIDAPVDWKEIEIISAAVYDNKHDYGNLAILTSPDRNEDTFKIVSSIWSFKDESELMGKILTILDSSIEDKERREATKSITRELIYDYTRKVRRQSERIREANEQEQKAQII